MNLTDFTSSELDRMLTTATAAMGPTDPTAMALRYELKRRRPVRPAPIREFVGALPPPPIPSRRGWLGWALLCAMACATTGGAAGSRGCAEDVPLPPKPAPIAPALKEAGKAAESVKTETKKLTAEQRKDVDAIKAVPALPAEAIPPAEHIAETAGKIDRQVDRLIPEVVAPANKAADDALVIEKRMTALEGKLADAEKALADEKDKARRQIQNTLIWISIGGFAAAAALVAVGIFVPGAKQAFFFAGPVAVFAGLAAGLAMFMFWIAVAALCAAGIAVIAGIIYAIVQWRKKAVAVPEIGQLNEDTKFALRQAAPAKAAAIYGEPGGPGYANIPLYLSDATIDMIRKMRESGEIKVATKDQPNSTTVAAATVPAA